MALSKQKVAAMRRAYEEEGLSQNAVAKRFGVAAQTVKRYREKQGWTQGDPEVYDNWVHTDLDDEPTTTTATAAEVNLNIEISDPDDDVEALRRELAEARAEAARLRPDVEVPFLTAENIEAELGTEKLNQLAESALASTLRKRRMDGYPDIPVGSSDYQAMLEEQKVSIKQEFVANQTRWAKTPGQSSIGTRTLKMVSPSGHSQQIVVEGQSNSETGKPTDAIRLFQSKGYKIMSPTRCYLKDCWRPQMIDAAGNPTAGGYCEQHRNIGRPREVIGTADDPNSLTSQISRMSYAGR